MSSLLGRRQSENVSFESELARSTSQRSSLQCHQNLQESSIYSNHHQKPSVLSNFKPASSINPNRPNYYKKNKHPQQSKEEQHTIFSDLDEEAVDSHDAMLFMSRPSFTFLEEPEMDSQQLRKQCRYDKNLNRLARFLNNKATLEINKEEYRASQEALRNAKQQRSLQTLVKHRSQQAQQWGRRNINFVKKLEAIQEKNRQKSKQQEEFGKSLQQKILDKRYRHILENRLKKQQHLKKIASQVHKKIDKNMKSVAQNRMKQEKHQSHKQANLQKSNTQKLPIKHLTNCDELLGRHTIQTDNNMICEFVAETVDTSNTNTFEARRKRRVNRMDSNFVPQSKSPHIDINTNLHSLKELPLAKKYYFLLPKIAEQIKADKQNSEMMLIHRRAQRLKEIANSDQLITSIYRTNKTENNNLHNSNIRLTKLRQQPSTKVQQVSVQVSSRKQNNQATQSEKTVCATQPNTLIDVIHRRNGPKLYKQVDLHHTNKDPEPLLNRLKQRLDSTQVDNLETLERIVSQCVF